MAPRPFAMASMPCDLRIVFHGFSQVIVGERRVLHPHSLCASRYFLVFTFFTVDQFDQLETLSFSML